MTNMMKQMTLNKNDVTWQWMMIWNDNELMWQWIMTPQRITDLNADEEDEMKSRIGKRWRGIPDSRNREEDIGWIARDVCVTEQSGGYTKEESVTDLQCDTCVTVIIAVNNERVIGRMKMKNEVSLLNVFPPIYWICS